MRRIIFLCDDPGCKKEIDIPAKEYVCTRLKFGVGLMMNKAEGYGTDPRGTGSVLLLHFCNPECFGSGMKIIATKRKKEMVLNQLK